MNGDRYKPIPAVIIFDLLGEPKINCKRRYNDKEAKLSSVMAKKYIRKKSKHIYLMKEYYMEIKNER